jgi:hypothetical protein
MNRIIPIQDKRSSSMLLFFWLSFLCFIAIGNNICEQNNGGCEQLCLPSPQSTIQCACADGFQLENDGRICLDIDKYFVIQTSQCVCFHVVLCDIYILNIHIVCDTRTCIHTCVSQIGYCHIWICFKVSVILGV